MSRTAADLDANIRRTEPGRAIPKDAQPPYAIGDVVAVLVERLFTGPVWAAGTVLECAKPMWGRRFKVKVSTGATINDTFSCERIYCWEDGSSEELVRLVEGNYLAQVDTLNAALKSLGRTSWITPGQRKALES